jgi:hypothetical protein
MIWIALDRDLEAEPFPERFAIAPIQREPSHGHSPEPERVAMYFKVFCFHAGEPWVNK